MNGEHAQPLPLSRDDTADAAWALVNEMLFDMECAAPDGRPHYHYETDTEYDCRQTKTVAITSPVVRQLLGKDTGELVLPCPNTRWFANRAKHIFKRYEES